MIGQQPTQRATIEWEMMDKTKFFPLSMLSTFSIRCVLYPLTLIKTRLQVQKRNAVYTGMFDAYGKIYKHEGFSGLYKGFWISSFQIVSGVCYLSVYETLRHILFTNNVKDTRLVALLSGGGASVVGQSIIVPFDVVSQHMMMTGIHTTADKAGFNSLEVQLKPHYSKFRITVEISKEIFRRDGFRGFYRGYWASLATYVPNSSLWWAFYHFYQEKLNAVAPLWISHLFLQAVAGTLGGFTTTIITNPLDVVRARLQVQRIGSVSRAFRELWREEGVWMFSKGLSARLVHSPFFSFSVILGYETIKRVSVKEEYRNQVRW